MVNSPNLRSIFHDFFERNGYASISSSSVIPQNDPSLFFINSGMAPLKKFFLGQDKPPHQKLNSIQKCIRAGGKHNDLELVGRTKRHHSFFEMCGNFAFGGVSKRDAIEIAWKFLVDELKIDHLRLQITVHPDDSEAYNIWQTIISKDRISFDAENVWAAGDEGPCGMCTEIYYDHRTGCADDIVEIWNIVFMTHNVKNGVKEQLQNMCIDTGIGFERLSAVLIGSPDNYDIPFFRDGICLIEAISGVKRNLSHRVIMDHVRCCCFMISEGIMPGNSGREYVLRRILRRAIRHESKISPDKHILIHIVDYIINALRNVYPEIAEYMTLIKNIIDKEREQYHRICAAGITQLEGILEDKGECSPEDAFKLYDTYGLHIDLIQDILQDRDMYVDTDEFNRISEANKNRSAQLYKGIDTSKYDQTIFLGYIDCVNVATVIGIIDAQNVSDILSVSSNDIGLILDATVMYPEGGGQECDHGIIKSDHWQFHVKHVSKYNDVIVHFGNIHDDASQDNASKDSTDAKMHSHSKHRITPQIGQACLVEINRNRRTKLTQHHSAAHLLLAALRHRYGDSIIQKGSLINENRLRLDFLYDHAVDTAMIERDINTWIQNNYIRHADWSSIAEAKESGALSTFGDKYGDIVRIVSIGHSKELCIGTHVERSGDIGSFYITKEYSIAANVRRIEAICGMAAYEYAANQMEQIKNICKKYNATPDTLEAIIDKKLHIIKQKASTISAPINMQSIDICDNRLKICVISGQDLSRGVMYNKIDDSIITHDIVFVDNAIQKSADNSASHALTLKLSKSTIDKDNKANTILQNLVSKYDGKAGGNSDIAHGSINRDFDLNDLIHELEEILKLHYAN